MACRFATCPTSRSPVLVNATTDGVVRPPSSFAITLGSPPSITATTEFVVPRSIPIIFAIAACLLKLLNLYKCLLLRSLDHQLSFYNNRMIRLECITVNVLDDLQQQEVANFCRAGLG